MAGCVTNIDNNVLTGTCPSPSNYVTLFMDDTLNPIYWRNTFQSLIDCMNYQPTNGLYKASAFVGTEIKLGGNITEPTTLTCYDIFKIVDSNNAGFNLNTSFNFLSLGGGIAGTAFFVDYGSNFIYTQDNLGARGFKAILDAVNPVQAFIGDFDFNQNGTMLVVDDATKTIVATNTALDVKVGINNNTPTVALDVVGDVRVANGGNNMLTLSGLTGYANIGTVGSDNYIEIDPSIGITISSSNNIKLINLSGTGTRCVQADSTGILSTTVSGCGGGGTPSLTATQIAFGNGSNVMTSSAQFVYDNGIFRVGNSNAESFLYINGAGAFSIGDANNLNDGQSFIISDASTAYVKNGSNNINFGINTETPSAALDVVGFARITNGQLSVHNGGEGVYLGDEVYPNEAGVYSPNGDQVLAGFNISSGTYKYANGIISVDESNKKSLFSTNGDYNVYISGAINNAESGLYSTDADKIIATYEGGIFAYGDGALIVNDFLGTGFYDNHTHTGKFGINTTSPSVALDVVGAASITGSLEAGKSAPYISGLLRVIGGRTELGDIANSVNGTYLQVDDNDKRIYFHANEGMVLPRMTKAERNAMAVPYEGCIIYQTDNTKGIRVYNGTNWIRYTEIID